MSDFETPMGNAELRLALATIESEVMDTKRIATETHDQAKKTNGRVNRHDRLLWLAMGALPLLTVWAGWLTKMQLDSDVASLTQVQVQAAVQAALSTYEIAK